MSTNPACCSHPSTVHFTRCGVSECPCGGYVDGRILTDLHAIDAQDDLIRELVAEVKRFYLEGHRIEQHFGDVWDCGTATCSLRRDLITKAEASHA
jgi:hypothetical protein